MNLNEAFKPWLESASNFSPSVDHLLFFLLCVTGFFTFGIFAFIVFFSLRYRRRSPLDRPKKIEGSNALEITWMVLPFFILLVMFAWGSDLFVKMRRPPTQAMQINVLAKQWMWKCQHDDGAGGGSREINTLTIPVDVPIKLTMHSEDVIHSFFIPAFRIKQDVLPSAFTEQWFTATKVGTYELFCAEYCGDQHSQMRGRVVVLPQNEYAEWLAMRPPEKSSAANGAELFKTYGCVTCHSAIAPTLSHVYGTEQLLDDGRKVLADETYLRESILDPQAKIVAGYGTAMPSFRGRLTEEQVVDLVQYIKSLSTPPSQPNGRPPAASQPADQPPGASERLPRGASSGTDH